jgi:hypothetical protein
MVADMALNPRRFQTWDVGLHNSDILDDLIAHGYTKAKVSRTGSKTDDTKWPIIGLPN